MKTLQSIGMLSCALALGSACATAKPPAELVQARQAYSMSERSVASRYNPAALHDAKKALDKAEDMYEDDPEAPEVRDASYVALRRAELAKVEGETLAMRAEQEEAARKAAQAQAAAAQQAHSELQAAREELEVAQAARLQAEQTASEALERLETSEEDVSVDQDERGMVITVGGVALFPSSKATLTPAANAKLDRIADALKQQRGKEIVIEGHTDSTGPQTLNEELSKERAEAVAAYLAARGVPRDNMTTEGVGPERPIADNKTPEGRATNRRVEITVK